MDILIDYLTMSDKEGNVAEYSEILNLNNTPWEVNRGWYGWETQLYHHGIKIHYGGREGVLLDISGTGCRYLEDCNKDFNWYQFLEQIALNHKNVSRLDIACDEKTGILDFEKLFRYTKERMYICKAKQARWTDGNEQQVLFGSPKSDSRLRIYNKALERETEGHWIRAEFQFRDDRAMDFIWRMLEYGSIGKAYCITLNNYLRYIEAERIVNGHYETAEVAEWWQEFTNTAEKCKNITIGGLSYNLETVVSYIEKQCASTLKLYLIATQGDLTGLMDLINASRLNTKQENLLNEIRGIHERESQQKDYDGANNRDGVDMGACDSGTDIDNTVK